MTYTLEAIRSFENRLFINTVLTIAFNSLAVYLILKHSATVMGNYKYYILSTVFFAFLMDFHLSFIWGMFPLYPYPGGCPAGIAKYLGPFWGAAVQYGIFHFTLTFCGLSIFFGLVYQYFSISNNKHFLKTLKGGICVGAFMFIYPLPSFILYLFNYSYPQFLEQLKIQNPKIVEFFISAACDGQVVTNLTVIYLGVASLEILILNVAAAFLVFKIVKKISAKKHQMSTATLKMRQQYFRALIIQLFLPIIFIMVPLFFFVAMILLGVKDIDSYTQLSIQFISLHSVANALTIMVVIKSYRQTLIRCFNTVFHKCKKQYCDTKSNAVFVQ